MTKNKPTAPRPFRVGRFVVLSAGREMPEPISAVGEGNEKKIVYLCTCDGREMFNGRRLMDKQQQNVAYFLTFCIEQYKNEKD